MKSILVVSLSVICFLFTTHAEARCPKEIAAIHVLKKLDRFKVDLGARDGILFETVVEAHKNIAANEFCGTTLMTGVLNPYSLCTILALEKGISGGLITKDKRNQHSLDKSLRDFGLLFPTENETNSFACDLKTLF